MSQLSLEKKLSIATEALKYYAKAHIYHEDISGVTDILEDQGDMALGAIHKIDPELYKKLNPDS